MEVVCAVFLAFHVILIGRLVQHIDVIKVVIGQYLVCGTLSTLTGIFVESNLWPALAASWWTVAYTGLLSVGLGYTLQAWAQKIAPPADAAVLLSSEAVFAALFGWLFLSEKLSATQFVGCGVILAGMLLAQGNVFSRENRK